MDVIELAKEAGLGRERWTTDEQLCAFLELFASLIEADYKDEIEAEWADLDSALKRCRVEALEEAAEVCEEGTGNAVQTGILEVLLQERDRIATAIRGLK